jgi:outer membrane immunogenic protein
MTRACSGIVAFIAVACLATSSAGPQIISGSKEMKEVAPAPAPECDWTGFYIGVHAGGQWGHSEDRDLDAFATANFGDEWGYDQSGAVAGAQLGYNWQWHWLVLGPEMDLGYMNLDGKGVSDFDRVNFNSDTPGSTSGDFYATFRGRIGVALGKFLIYGTGGGIVANYETNVDEDCNLFPCGSIPLHAHKQQFDWGWTGGGGVEFMIGCHWTIKAEYLHFKLDDQDFSGNQQDFTFTPINQFHFTGIGAEGNIVRGGLNYKF